MTDRRAVAVALMALGMVWPWPARGQSATPTVTIKRASPPPLIDGRLDDAIWKDVATIDDFRQREPLEGQPASEATVVRVAYDDTRLYFAVEMHSADPSEIRATELRRDNTFENDDTFAILLDTYHDHRNAFVFKINARGTRFDGVVRNEGSISADWDEDWTAATVRTGTGWTAEIAIPFKVLRFRNADAQEWGLNFERTIRARNEFDYWSGWDRNFTFTHVSQAGHLGGIDRIQAAERFRLRPYALAGTRHLEAPGDGRLRGLGDIGIDDFKIAVTSNLTADLAVNPDFAQTEADTQQVNLTRYSVFFPEKRQFFVENADSLQLRTLGYAFGATPLEVFYSRRVGLSDRGEPLRILGGGKLTGRVGPYEVGFLDAQTEATGEAPSTNFLVGRVRRQVLGRSYLGAIVTNRESGDGWNRVAGGDARVVVRNHLTLSGMVARSFDSRPERDGWVRQLGADYQVDLVEARVNYIEIDPSFTPDAGYVRRHDRLLGARLAVSPRPKRGPVRQLDFISFAAVNHNTGGDLVGRSALFQVSAKLQSGDSAGPFFQNELERLPVPLVLGGVTIPAGVYNWNTIGAGIRSYRGRWITVNLDAATGSFYNGSKQTYAASLDVRPNKNMSFNPTYALNDISLPGGDFQTHLFGLRSNISFSTRLLTSAYIQYNSSGELAALQLRLNYIFRRIDNLFIVYNDTHFTGGLFADRSNRSLVAKVTYSITR